MASLYVELKNKKWRQNFDWRPRYMVLVIFCEIDSNERAQQASENNTQERKIIRLL